MLVGILWKFVVCSFNSAPLDQLVELSPICTVILSFFFPLISPAQTGGGDPKVPTPSPSVASGRHLQSRTLGFN